MAEGIAMADATGVFCPPEHLIILQTEDWILNHRVDATLPGYLMLGARVPCNSLSQMSERALSQLGPLLAKAQHALESVLEPHYVYVGRYGHTAGHALHFHIIPVCAWVLRGLFVDPRYRLLQSLQSKTGPAQPDGAEVTLYIWREFCESPSPPPICGPSVNEAIAMLKACLRKGDEADKSGDF